MAHFEEQQPTQNVRKLSIIISVLDY